MRIRHHKEKGAAFLYVVLIFAAASVIAAGLLSRENMEMVRTRRFLDHMQAVQYAYGAEAYARQLLFADIQPSMTNKASKRWGGVPMVFTISDGTVAMSIEDLSGRFNINSLLGGDQAAEDHFTNLCAALSIDDSLAEPLLTHFRQINALAGTSPSQTPQWLVDPSELIDYGLPIDAYTKLAPYLAALPATSYAININAASDPVLEAYGVRDTQLEALHDLLHDSDVITSDRLTVLNITDTNIATTSNYFRMHANIQLEGQGMRLSSTFAASSNNNQQTILTIARAWGEDAVIPLPEDPH